VHQVVQPQATKQLAFTRPLEGQLVLVSPVKHQQELEQLLFRLLVLQQAVQLQLVYTLLREQQPQMERQASLQFDSLFRHEVLLVQEMEIRLFPPFTRTSELLRLAVQVHPITQFSTQISEPLKVRVPQLQVTLH
jgi:hypothetical protein